jgi:hypothetical protein
MESATEVTITASRAAVWRILTDAKRYPPVLVDEDPIGYNVPFHKGLWLRAPYLPNGLVATLEDLLTTTDQRSKGFWRACDVYDPERAGRVTTGPEAEPVGTKHDTSLRANSAQGCTFGTDLSAGAKEP